MRNGISTVTLRHNSFQCRLANSSYVKCQVGKAKEKEHKWQVKPLLLACFD